MMQDVEKQTPDITGYQTELWKIHDIKPQVHGDIE